MKPVITGVLIALLLVGAMLFFSDTPWNVDSFGCHHINLCDPYGAGCRYMLQC